MCLNNVHLCVSVGATEWYVLFFLFVFYSYV